MIDSQHLLGGERDAIARLASRRRVALAIRAFPSTERAERITSPRRAASSERGVAVKIDVIEGIGTTHTSALSRAGVTHVRHLLQRGRHARAAARRWRARRA